MPRPVEDPILAYSAGGEVMFQENTLKMSVLEKIAVSVNCTTC